MDGNYRAYSYTASSQRIAGILDQPAGQFEEVNALPDPDRLTYSNGFYGRCSAVFVDIRDSSKLPSRYKRPRLAKQYRSFISEMVSVLNGYVFVREMSIVGDCVWATYNTPYTSNIEKCSAWRRKRIHYAFCSTNTWRSTTMSLYAWASARIGAEF